MGGFGADAGRAARARHHRSRGGGPVRAARRAGDAEDAHRLVRERQERGARSRAQRRAPASRWSPCMAARANKATRAPVPKTTHRGNEAGRALFRSSPTATSIHPRKPARRWPRPCPRHHGRSRRAGPAMDLPRDRALPRNRRALLPPAPDTLLQAKAWLVEHLQDHYGCTANSPACAPRASTSAGTCAACPGARTSAAA